MKVHKFPKVHVKPHAVDPENKNLVPLESALVPYVPENSKSQDDNNFDILELLADCDDDELVMAATQVQQNQM